MGEIPAVRCVQTPHKRPRRGVASARPRSQTGLRTKPSARARTPSNATQPRAGHCGLQQAHLLGHDHGGLVMRRLAARPALQRDPGFGHRRVLRVELAADELAAVPAADDAGGAGARERVEDDAGAGVVVVGA
jgi:hypothetical protein